MGLFFLDTPIYAVPLKTNQYFFAWVCFCFPQELPICDSIGQQATTYICNLPLKKKRAKKKRKR
jgi:hypothetical protein